MCSVTSGHANTGAGEPVYEFPIPYLEECSILVYKMPRGLFEVWARFKMGSRMICTVREGEVQFSRADHNKASAALKLTMAEQFCFAILPPSYPVDHPDKFPQVLKDPLWQEIANSAAVFDVMER